MSTTDILSGLPGKDEYTRPCVPYKSRQQSSPHTETVNMRLTRAWTCFIWALVFTAASFVLLGSLVPLTRPSSIIDNAVNSATPRRFTTRPSKAQDDLLEHIQQALSVLQTENFSPWIGTWDKAIDWTAAVTATHVSGALRALSTHLEQSGGWQSSTVGLQMNQINMYFEHVLAYYFGQDHFALRNEAYDDILWVVLGWLETIQFIDQQSSVYSPSGEILWHANTWVPAFSHRARIFWELSTHGWDRELCGGGMTWNPRLEPYKNAITNELFIAASASMYQYFPGDNNSSPFSTEPRTLTKQFSDQAKIQLGEGVDPHDFEFLLAASAGYNWLESSDMRNDQGLFIDGFHISGIKDPSRYPKKCDIRNEQVYTYNQGVILTGLVNLYKATQDTAYLVAGHELIRNVIAATGFSLATHTPKMITCDDDSVHLNDCRTQLPRPHGLGRAGVMEEECDIRGDCSQDGQAFKGIFFHHLTAFCDPLTKYDSGAVGAQKLGMPPFVINGRVTQHAEACMGYMSWLDHNVEAALATRDSKGQFGMWWTVGILPSLQDKSVVGLDQEVQESEAPDTFSMINDRNRRAVDYRNGDELRGEQWRSQQTTAAATAVSDEIIEAFRLANKFGGAMPAPPKTQMRDWNDRGRGRTLETQGGGLAVLRCAWQLHNWYDGYGGSGQPVLVSDL